MKEILNNNNSTGVIQIGQNREEGTEIPACEEARSMTGHCRALSGWCKEALQEGHAGRHMQNGCGGEIRVAEKHEGDDCV